MALKGDDFLEDIKFLNIRHEDGSGNVDHFYIPVKRQSDNAVGWYEVIGDEFREASSNLKAPD